MGDPAATLREPRPARGPTVNRYVRPVRDWDYLLDVVLARPGMYVGLPSFERVAAFVEGFGTAVDDGTLNRFRLWLAQRSGQPQSPLGWAELALRESSSASGAGSEENVEARTVARLRALLSEFRASEKDAAR